MLQVLIAGLSLGLLSSLHCVGMCGPLMLALPVRHLGRMQQLAALLLYNVGRVFTYSMLGLLIGLAGRRIYLAGLQQWLSIAMGVVILLIAIAYFVFKKSLQPRWMTNLQMKVQLLMGKALQSKKMSGYFALGAANGLLPCGMVYMAIAGAFMTSSVQQSTLFMVLFGAGTFPAMLAFGYFGTRITVSSRQKLKKAMPVFVMVIAVLLILRGMNLGIPFVSPMLEAARGGAVSCHP